MQVNRIQTHNNTFGAKLKVINKDFSKKFFADLQKKADNIGSQHDVIELKYTDFQDIKENICFGRKNILEKNIKRISDTFHGRYIPVGDEYGTDHYETRLTSDKYIDLWKMEEDAASKYLYILSRKYIL